MALPDAEWEAKLVETVGELGAEIDIPGACFQLAKLIDQANDECCGCGWAAMMADALGKVRPGARARPS